MFVPVTAIDTHDQGVTPMRSPWSTIHEISGPATGNTAGNQTTGGSRIIVPDNIPTSLNM